MTHRKPGPGRRFRRSLLFPLLALLAGCAAGDGFGSSDPDPLGPRIWTFLLSDSVSGTAWVLQTDSAVAVAEAEASATSAALWTALDSAPSRRGLVVHAAVSGREMQFMLTDGDVPAGRATGQLLAYHGGGGAPRYAGSATVTLEGRTRVLRFDAISGVPLPPEPFAIPAAPPPGVQPRAVVSLRADDCNTGESEVLALLVEHRLTAEFAVPSRLVGRPGHCNWMLVDSLAAAGNAIEAHSRFHDIAPKDFAEFYLETVGAARDLAARGHQPNLWVQPGSWLQGPAHLDGPPKLASPYGALLRRLYGAVEAYTSPDAGSALSYACRSTHGPVLYFLKDFDEATLRATLDRVSGTGRWVEFMWHTGDQPIDRLGRQLAIIAEYRDAGVLAVMPVYRALVAGVTDAP